MSSIGRHDVERLIAGGAQVVDVMPAGDYRESHIAGAINIPLAKLGELAPKLLDRERPVVVYCFDSL